MDFEFDPAKSQSNKDKHGIDFGEAKALWLDEKRLVAPLETTSEERYIMIAQLRGKCWSTVYTYRNDRLRIISVRRSRDKERQRYEDDQR
ncbi:MULTISPECIES: BrnT family toxin [Agrobacterium]|uniref:BrnT family toxin n=1 Tax=Agrobacterium burrii TaxID=2815339 RepID=A0ABS3EFR0_9HYPH|nr:MULTISPECIES: BrnT family toxin [Agrobacterium]MBO0130800.1 BrnT family toxin [Agrobacterium burrii]MQB10531.1 BrnT family toxin [Agrobacterium sp. ICMP 6402]NTZ90577.1 BrnT family toxin [Agrobacterium tumefaciens]